MKLTKQTLLKKFFIFVLMPPALALVCCVLLIWEPPQTTTKPGRPKYIEPPKTPLDLINDDIDAHQWAIYELEDRLGSFASEWKTQDQERLKELNGIIWKLNRKREEHIDELRGSE